MSFFENIAAALDAEGIESRVNDDIMFVPITSDLEIQFVEIDPLLPAANVYIAAADVDEDDEDFEAVLVSVAFSVEDAVEAVARHIATDQVVTVLRDLLEGTDERIAELEFMQDEFNPNLVVAEVANDSELRVLVETVDGVPSAIVRFLSFAYTEDDLEGIEDTSEVDDYDDATIQELWDVDSEQGVASEEPLSDGEYQLLLESSMFDGAEPIIEIPAETLELGTYIDFDRLFDVLGLVAERALDWESQLVPFDAEEFDEPDVYDIYGEDTLDEELESELEGYEDDEDDDDDDDDLEIHELSGSRGEEADEDSEDEK